MLKELRAFKKFAFVFLLFGATTLNSHLLCAIISIFALALMHMWNKLIKRVHLLKKKQLNKKDDNNNNKNNDKTKKWEKENENKNT